VLSHPDRLTPQPGGDGALIWVDPKADFGSYNALLIEHIRVRLADNAEYKDIDPAATDALQRMSDYLGLLQQFSVHTQADVEDLLDSGQRVDYAISAELAVSRPNKLRSERKGDPVDQVFYYDGKQLTLYDRSHKVYAGVDAPPTLEKMFDFAQDSLGLVLVGTDLIYHDAYPLLMEGVTSATVIGKSVIDGATYADLLDRQGPVAIATGTDLSTGARLAFYQNDFDLLCSDLNTVRFRAAGRSGRPAARCRRRAAAPVARV